MIRPAVTERKADRRQPGHLCRPWLELLEARLPPGDTLLGLLVSGDLLDEPFTDSSLDSDSSFILHASSFDAEHLATWPTPDTMWPGGPVDATLVTSTTSDNSEGHLANSQHTTVIWPPALRIVPHRATTEWIAVTAAPPSFPNSGSGTPLRETPFRRLAGDETEFLGGAFPNGSSGTSDAEANYGSLPFYFEQNVGQADDGFDFVARGAGYTLGLGATELVMSVQNSESRIQNSEIMSDLASVDASARRDRPAHRSDPAHVGLTPRRSPDSLVRMQLVGANPAAGAGGVSPLSTRVNYFLGNEPNEWHTNVPTFAKVHYDDVYPGIDLVYYAAPPSPAAGRGDGGEGALEYDFVVSPGTDPNQIQLNFTGADSIKIDTNGDLVLSIATDNGSAYGGTTDNFELRQQKPYLYQEVNGQRQQVAGAFRIQNSESGIQNQQFETQNSKLKTR